MKLVSSLLIASALASAVSASLAIAQPVPPRLPPGTAKQPPALEGRPSAPVRPPTLGPFRPMCTPNPAVAPYQHTPATCEDIRRARSFAPYLYNSCVTNVFTKIGELLTAMDSLDPFKVADARDSTAELVESVTGGLAGYLIGCTTEGFFAAVKGQFPSTESALVNSLNKAKGVPEVMRGRDAVAITRYIVDFRATLEEARSEANSVREYFEQGLYQSAYYQARDAMTRSGNIVAASVSSPTCDTIHADSEVRNATELAMQHVVAMRRELAENGDKLRCAVEYVRTTALELPHRQVQEMAIQRLTRDVREAGPQRVRDAEALLAETGRQCARVQEWAQRCGDPPDTTRSAGVCAGQVAGDWRVTQRTATGRHEQDWTIAADGRAAPKGSQVPLQARGHVTDRRLVIAVRDGAGNYADHIVAELEPSCIRGTGSITTMISSQLGARKEQMEIRRLGEPSAVASPSGGPPAPPLRPDAAIVTPGVGPQISPQAGVPQGSPLPTQPAVPQPFGQQPVAPPPAAAPTVACNQLVGAPIYAKWAQLGGERGLLGCAMHGQVQATTSPQGTPGTYVRFQHGIITYMAGGARANQAYEVHGRILEAYGQLGGSASWLGFPISDEYDVPGGRRSDFEGGYIFWDRATNQARAERGAPPTTAAAPPAPPAPQPAAQATPANSCGHTLGGGIFGKWQQLGGERGLLGCPTMSEADANRSPQGSTGKWANFQHGLITWMFTGPKVNQGFEVHGLIKNLYMQMGGSGSWLGFPLSDEYDVAGGRRSDFEGGYIFWDRATNQARAERPGAPVAAPPQPPPATAGSACGYTLGGGIYRKWQETGR